MFFRHSITSKCKAGIFKTNILTELIFPFLSPLIQNKPTKTSLLNKYLFYGVLQWWDERELYGISTCETKQYFPIRLMYRLTERFHVLKD